jgi:hypothetical protein
VTHTLTRHLTPEHGTETIGSKTIMAYCWRHGEHAHVVLRHGILGCHCGSECRAGGIKEWKP